MSDFDDKHATSPSTDEDAGRAPAVVPPEAGPFGRLIDKLGVLFAFGFLASATVLIFEIFIRHLLDAPTLWAHETTTFLCAIGFVFGGLFCAAHNKHIRVVPLYDNVGPKVRRWLDVFIYLTCAGATGFFSFAAWKVAEKAVIAPGGAFRLQTSGSAWNPPTPALLKIFLLTVLIAMTVMFLVFAIAHLRGKPSHD